MEDSNLHTVINTHTHIPNQLNYSRGQFLNMLIVFHNIILLELFKYILGKRKDL